MKKTIFTLVLMMVALLANAAEPNQNKNNNSVKYTVMTDANGEIASVLSAEAASGSYAWHIRDLSGYTNIRNRPNGKVCMRLKAHTQYEIYGDQIVNGWLRMTGCYNMREGYWVRFHSSSTGNYWIATSILY